ncbi:MAG: prolyl oligopeptidase family serine peptidase, partial [Flavobacteriales bacterium]|nr:prolyl oligopeptidase family serine peptidase [Flavobacteriales bacterium]
IQRVLHYDEESQELIVLGTGSPIETVAYQVPLDGSSMTRITLESGLHRVKVSDTGKYMIDAYSSLEIPRRTVIRDRSGKVVKTLLDAPDPLKGKKIGTTEIFTIQAEDGTDLYCRMIKPSDFDASKKYPVFVYVYNGPHVQLIHDTWLGAASLWMHHLAEQGYIIFTLDGRGSSNRGLKFEQAVHRQLGLLEVKDQMAGVEYLRSQPFVDADRMAVHGWSYGGYMTLNLMLRQPDAFKVGVAGGAVTDWRFYEVMYTERYMDSPADNPSGYETTRLSSLADKLEGDLLLIHNTSDDIVVPQHYMVMMNAFINADKQVDTFIYPGHKHNVRGPDRVHLIERIVDYVNEHL